MSNFSADNKMPIIISIIAVVVLMITCCCCCSYNVLSNFSILMYYNYPTPTPTSDPDKIT
jgi:hypothetical protein